jgi:hypothetical protein
MEKEIIFIYGMGRSGTSLITKLLEICGGVLPESLLGPGIGNEKGHWEPIDSIKINDEFLFLNNSSWYDPRLDLSLTTNNSVSNSEKKIFVEKIYNFLRNELSEETLIIKDPRIAGLGIYWAQALYNLQGTAKYVIPVRHPLEVAASLKKRDNLSEELSILLWLKYNLLAERQSRGAERIFVSYNNIIKDQKRELTRIDKALKTRFNISAKSSEIEEYISPQLYHNRYTKSLSSQNRGTFLQNWAECVYSELYKLSNDEPSLEQNIDSVYDNYLEYDKIYGTAITESVSISNSLKANKYQNI